MVPLLREARVLPYTLVSVATETLSKARRPLELLKVLFFVSKKLGSLVLFFLLLGAEPKLVSHTNVGWSWLFDIFNVEKFKEQQRFWET